MIFVKPKTLVLTAGLLLSAVLCRPASATSGAWANPATVTTTSLTSTSGSSNLTWAGSAFSVGREIRLTTPVPGGFSTNTNYFVVFASGTTIRLATTFGGTAIIATNSVTNGSAQAYQSWQSAANWTGGTAANGTDAVATFTNAPVASVPGISLDGNVTLGKILFSNDTASSDMSLISGSSSANTLTFATSDGTAPMIEVPLATVRLLNLGGTGVLKISGTQGLVFRSSPQTGIFTGSGLDALAGAVTKNTRLTNVDWSGLSGGISVDRGELAGQAANQLGNRDLTIGTAFSLANSQLAGFSFGNGDQNAGRLDGNELGRIWGGSTVRTLTIGGDSATGGNFAGILGQNFAGATSGVSINLTKSGSGTQTFSGRILGTGSITVNGGTLLINGLLHQGSGVDGGRCIVGSSGTLGGTGTLYPSDTSANLTAISMTGSLAPGDPSAGGGIGTLLVDGQNCSRPVVAFGSGAQFQVQLAPGLAADRLELVHAQPGDLAFNQTAIHFSGPADLPTGAYTLLRSDLAMAYTGLSVNASSVITGGLTISSGLADYPGSHLKIAGNDIVLVLLNPASPVPSAPAQVTATGGNLATTVTWTAAEQASGYRVLRATSADGPFTLLGTVDAPATTFRDSTGVIGVAYFYQIVGTNTQGEGSPAVSAAAASFDDGKIDTIIFGDGTSESAHALVASSAETLTGALGEPARRLLPKETAEVNGGDLAFTMAVDPVRRNYVTVKFWGGDDTIDLMGRIYLYVPVDGIDYQVGYRHEGDYMPLSVASSKPPLPGRFFYSTTLLPLPMTQGKTSLTLKLVSTGKLYGLGSGGPPTGNYQFNMTVPSRGIYRAYTHVAAILTPDDETQGSAPASNVRPALSEASVLGASGTYTNGLNGYVNGRLAAAVDAFNATDVALLARSHSVPQISAGYQNPAVVAKVVAVLDGFAADYYANPATSLSTSNYGRAGGNEVWGGRLGPLGWAVHLLLPQLQPDLDTVVNYGTAGGDRTRRQAWGDMLVASFDYGRFTRDARTITNQTLIASENIYKANRGALDLGHAGAVSESAAQRYLREAVGLTPWLGSDLPGGGSSAKLGGDYLQVTAQGLTREWGYVGGYGEMQGYAADFFKYTGNPEFRDQAVKMIKARAPFRRPALEMIGNNIYRSVERIGLISWRGVRESDGDYANDICYGEAGSWSTAMRVAGTSLDPDAVGYAKQMIADNQFFSQLISDSRFYSGLTFDSRKAFEVYDEYAAVKNAPDSGIRLPMTAGQPDFVWKDEQSGVIAIKHGEERLWIAPYWQAKSGTAINGIGRFHLSTPTYDQYGVLETAPRYLASGAWMNRSATMIDYPERTLWAPASPPLQAYGGERLPIGFIPAGVSDDGPYRGKAEFWAFRFGRYLIGMNRSGDRSFELKTPFGFATAPDLVTGSNVSGPVSVQPGATVALYLDQPYDPAPLPSPPLLLISNGAALEWSASSGATSYRVKRSATLDGVFETVAENLTGLTWTDPTPPLGAFYQVHAVNVHGESDSPTRIAPGTGILPPPWQSVDIGSTGLAGGGVFADGAFTVRGAGTNLTASADAFHFTYRPLAGDGVFIARLASRVVGGTADDKVGIMLRESTSADSRNFAVFLDDLYDSARVSWRTTDGGSTSSADGAASSFPVWMKIERAGDTIRGYQSVDGLVWNLITTRSMSFSTAALVGLFVCSRNADALDFSTFDHVGLTTSLPTAAPFLSAAAGDTTVALGWTPPEGASGFRLKRSLVSGGPYEIIADLTAASFTDTSLINAVTYHYVLTAVNPLGEGPPSAEVRATPIGAEQMRPPSIVVGAGGAVGLAIANSVSGRNYQLQRSDTLAGWLDIGPVIPGNGGLLQFGESVDPATTPRRFYRVVIGE